MPAPDHGFKIVTHSAGQRLAEIGHVHTDAWAPITSEVQTVERLADRAFRGRLRREEFVVYFEACTYWDDSVLWSVLGKSGLLSERERLPTRCLIYVLHPRNYHPPGEGFQLQVAGLTTQFVAIHPVPLWEVEPDRSWDRSPALMALYPLCRHPEPPSGAIQHAAGVIRQGARDTAERADLLSVLGIFGRLAYPELDPVALIGREHMRESPLYQDIMDEGAVLETRRSILNFLGNRFGKRAANSVELGVNAVEALPRLRELVAAAGRCDSIQAFREELEGPRPAPSPRRRPSTRR